MRYESFLLKLHPEINSQHICIPAQSLHACGCSCECVCKCSYECYPFWVKFEHQHPYSRSVVLSLFVSDVSGVPYCVRWSGVFESISSQTHTIIIHLHKHTHILTHTCSDSDCVAPVAFKCPKQIWFVVSSTTIRLPAYPITHKQTHSRTHIHTPIYSPQPPISLTYAVPWITV